MQQMCESPAPTAILRRTEAGVQHPFSPPPLFSSSPQSMFAYKQPIGALMILSELATRAPTRSKNRRVIASIKRSFDSRGCRDLCHPDFRNRTYSIGRAWPFPGPSPRGCNGLPICVTRAVARHEGVITVQIVGAMLVLRGCYQNSELSSGPPRLPCRRCAPGTLSDSARLQAARHDVLAFGSASSSSYSCPPSRGNGRKTALGSGGCFAWG
jgi:hypothetical protein